MRSSRGEIAAGTLTTQNVFDELLSLNLSGPLVAH